MPTLLLLDDSIDFLLALKIKLEAAHFTVTSFSSCVGAMEYVAEATGEFDIILSDLKMPDASGLDFLAGFREADTTTPFFIMTGDETFDANKTIELGGQGTFYKPLDINSLVKSLRAALPQ